MPGALHSRAMLRHARICPALEQPAAAPAATLGFVLFGRAEWLVDQALNARFLGVNWQYLHWRLELLDLLACAEAYLGRPYRHRLQRYIAEGLRWQ